MKAATKESRLRNWCFTLNNYADVDVQRLSSLCPPAPPSGGQERARRSGAVSGIAGDRPAISEAGSVLGGGGDSTVVSGVHGGRARDGRGSHEGRQRGPRDSERTLAGTHDSHGGVAPAAVGSRGGGGRCSGYDSDSGSTLSGSDSDGEAVGVSIGGSIVGDRTDCSTESGGRSAGPPGVDGTVYVCFQPERGLQGTPHLQGVICFANARTLAGVKRVVGRTSHCEGMRGRIDQAVEYCRKDDSRDASAGFGFLEFGRRPTGAGAGRGHRSDIVDAVGALRSGASFADIAEAHPDVAVRFSTGILRVQACFQRPRDFKTIVRWYYGSTGTGKSRAAFEEAGEGVYVKMPGNKWWDGYEGQEAVIIDDYRRDLCPFHQLLNLFDRYQYRVEFKGGACQFRAKTIWVTTPKSPQETWEGRCDEELQQLLRRVDIVKRFGEEPAPALFVDGFNPA